MAGLGTDLRRMSIAGEQTSSDGGKHPAPAADVHRSRRWLLALLVLALVLVGAAGFAAWQVKQLDDRERAREQALAEAETRVPLLLSYRFSTLEDDLATALAQTTGDFTDDYRNLLDDVVTPTATQRQIATEATVNAAGVVSADEQEVVVLVFLTQSTTTRTSHDPAVSGSRVEVTMRRVGEDWKIAALEPR